VTTEAAELSVLLDIKSVQISIHFGKYLEFWGDGRREQLKQDGRIEDLQFGYGRRLKDFLEILKDCSGRTPAVTSGEINDLHLLDLLQYKLFVSLTRPRCCPFSERDLDQIEEYVNRGGSLLVLSNHHGYAVQDSKLTERFDVSLQGYYGRRNPSLTVIDRASLGDHPITSGLCQGIVFNTSCYMSCNHPKGEVLATIPGVENAANQFGVAIGGHRDEASGKVAILCDSGFVGNDDTKFPERGFIGLQSNRDFVKNIVNWLCE